MSKRDVNVGFRIGQLISGLECARSQLEWASRSKDLLEESDEALIKQAYEIVAALCQRSWSKLP